MGTRRQFFHLNGNNVNAKQENAEYNIAILGDLGVGKSALTVKYLTKRFIMEYDPTLEGTFAKSENINGQDIIVKLMDTYDTENSKQERYLAWANGFLVVYSITSRDSFEVTKSYLDSITNYLRITGKEWPIALVGNKVDLERYRTVSKAEGARVATQHDCSFHETTAAEDYESVQAAFHSLIREIARVKERQMPQCRLFISEDNREAPSPSGQGTGNHRRPDRRSVMETVKLFLFK